MTSVLSQNKGDTMLINTGNLKILRKGQEGRGGLEFTECAEESSKIISSRKSLFECNTVKTQIEETCARTLEFPFRATRGENTEKHSHRLGQNKRNIRCALLGEVTPTS